MLLAFKVYMRYLIVLCSTSDFVNENTYLICQTSPWWRLISLYPYSLYCTSRTLSFLNPCYQQDDFSFPVNAIGYSHKNKSENSPTTIMKRHIWELKSIYHANIWCTQLRKAWAIKKCYVLNHDIYNHLNAVDQRMKGNLSFNYYFYRILPVKNKKEYMLRHFPLSYWSTAVTSFYFPIHE